MPHRQAWTVSTSPWAASCLARVAVDGALRTGRGPELLQRLPTGSDASRWRTVRIDVLLALHEEFHLEDTPLAWRVQHPPPELRQLLELVRLHHLFEILPPRPAFASLP